METERINSVELGRLLADWDESHRIYLCEYGLVHLTWGENSLVYCPGDLLGLPYLLTALLAPCGPDCTPGKCCVLDGDHAVVNLPYGSVTIPFIARECQQLQLAAQQAANHLYDLKSAGFFSNQTWLPQKSQEIGAGVDI